jgi:hypothetical protein
MGMTAAGAAGFERSMNMSFGSITVDQTFTHAFFASRFFKTISTGASGAGKRSDSLKLRLIVFASSVVSHSP